jgi:hypothetical protein
MSKAGGAAFKVGTLPQPPPHPRSISEREYMSVVGEQLSRSAYPPTLPTNPIL